MAEYIDRSKLGIGYADPKVFDNPAYGDGWNSAIKIINEAPSADVTPVVRCKYCKHHSFCFTEDRFVYAELSEDRRFCGLGEKN